MSNPLRLASIIASMGNIMGDVKTPAEDLAWKKRMIKAQWSGMGLDWPKDFDALSGTEQLKRLDKVIKIGLEKDLKKISEILKEKDCNDMTTEEWCNNHSVKDKKITCDH